MNLVTATAAALKEDDTVIFFDEPHKVKSAEHQGDGRYELKLECEHMPEGVAVFTVHGNKLFPLVVES